MAELAIAQANLYQTQAGFSQKLGEGAMIARLKRSATLP